MNHHSRNKYHSAHNLSNLFTRYYWLTNSTLQRRNASWNSCGVGPETWPHVIRCPSMTRVKWQDIALELLAKYCSSLHDTRPELRQLLIEAVKSWFGSSEQANALQLDPDLYHTDLGTLIRTQTSLDGATFCWVDFAKNGEQCRMISAPSNSTCPRRNVARDSNGKYWFWASCRSICLPCGKCKIKPSMEKTPLHEHKQLDTRSSGHWPRCMISGLT